MSSFIDLSTTDIERSVRSANSIANAWLLPRKTSAVKLHPKSAESSLLGLQVFLDKWLLSVYSEGLLYLWDLRVSQSAIRCASLDLGSERWTSFAAALEHDLNVIMIAMTSASSQITKVYRVELRRSESVFSPNNFELLRIISNPAGSSVVRAIDPGLQLVVFSTSDVVEVVKWRDDPEALRFRVSLQTDDLEEMWNGIIAVRLVDPYILIFKTRSVELCPLSPTDTEGNNSNALHLVHRFPSTTFRDISCSDFLHPLESGSDDMKSLRLCFLAHDVLQGVFQYLIHIHFPMASHLAPAHLTSLDVECIGVYPMANNINIGAIRPLRGNTGLASPIMVPARYESPAPSPLPTPTPTPSRHNLSVQGAGHGMLNPSARGFVSAVALGPQGKRAVWVERKRSNTKREVLVWGMDRGFDDDYIVDQNLMMDGKVVYVVGSYDLREDLTHCAISEVSGLVILGNRTGDLFRLGLD
ncbi:hypothetical protein BDZ94DRAFT_1263433 [Collybia nuda]|uniref:Uncharacterized protein n=1 Tax=Collybia nuda TaxID=64659 RepID=A0A9P5Y1B9_9AGAR|nr:hypothetical protein BDZ94DRAFT_1263433 [Collybia nuda]